jgi:hypothetical protein
MGYNLVFDAVYKNTKDALCKSFLTEIKKILPEESKFFGDEKGKFQVSSAQYEVKVSKDNFDAIVKKRDNFVTKDSKTVKYNLNGAKIAFIVSSKNAPTSSQDAASTKKQENASCIAIETYLKTNKHASIEDIKKEYPDCDDKWYQCFIAQAEAYKKWWGGKGISGYEIQRDCKFMDFISDIIKKKFKYPQKDAWNPADIWMYEKGKIKGIMDDIELINSIDQLNAYMINLFNQKILVGISLKKTGKIAHCEVTNVDKKKRDIFYELDTVNLYMALDFKNNFITPELSCVIKSSDSGTILKGQSRVFGGSSLKTNCQFEIMGRIAAARLGKVPKAGIANVFDRYNFSNPTWKDVPLSYEDFMKEQSKWKKYWQTISGANFAVTKIQTNEFMDTMKTVYQNEPFIVESSVCVKLQNMILAYYFTSLKKDDRDELITDFVYLAKKEDGAGGPFVKIH